MPRRPLAVLALAALGGGCDLYIREDEVDGPFNDARRPADALELDAGRDGPGGDPSMLPTVATRAHAPVAGGWVDIGAPDWSCLGVPRDAVTTLPLELSGRVIDRETGATVGQQAITALPSPDPGPALGKVFSATDSSGAYSGTFDPLPGGATRYAFRIAATSVNQPVNFLLEQYFSPGTPQVRDLQVMSLATANTLPTFVGQVRDTSRAMVLGSVLDCQARTVSNAKVVVSSVIDQLVPAGVKVAFFNSGNPSLPSSINGTTNSDGQFLVLDLPAEFPLYVQVWGFADETDLQLARPSLFAVRRMQLPAASVAAMRMEPRQDVP